MFCWFAQTLLLFLVFSCSAQDTVQPPGSAATSCDACHKLARCHTTNVLDNNVDTVGVLCRCEDGLMGDGFTCYNKTTCDSGYRWSPQLGCVDIDECSQPNQPCGPGQLCQNSPGSFLCLPGPASVQPRAKPRPMQFSCEGVTCPEGQDCVMVNGGYRCDDPCVRNLRSHTEWRATNYTKGSNCDSHQSNNWYEFSPYDNIIRMPERCIEPKSCGTDIPLWLKTPHPALGDGIIQAEVCGKANGDCCFHKSSPIYVKACARDKYVYKLSPVSMCNMGYCADVNTDVCATCQDYEMCVSKDKINFRCELREETGLLKPELVCDHDQMSLIIRKDLLEKLELNSTSGHMNDPQCNQRLDHQEAVWYTLKRSSNTCGTTVKSNRTHIMYSNTLFMYRPSAGHNDYRARRIPFTCAFPVHNLTSLDTSIQYQPLDGVADLQASGEPFNASITLYQRSDFREPHPPGKLLLPLGTPLFVLFSVDFDNAVRPLVEECYTTKSSSADDPDRQYLIRNRCPLDYRHVNLNYISQKGVHYRMMLFNTTEVYMHCRVGLCDYGSTHSCFPWCSRRQARSLRSPSQLPVSIGPISWF